MCLSISTIWTTTRNLFAAGEDKLISDSCANLTDTLHFPTARLILFVSNEVWHTVVFWSTTSGLEKTSSQQVFKWTHGYKNDQLKVSSGCFSSESTRPTFISDGSNFDQLDSFPFPAEIQMFCPENEEKIGYELFSSHAQKGLKPSCARLCRLW